MKNLITVFCFAVLSSCGPKLNSEKHLDIDNNVYQSATINNQEWLISNLSVTKFSNGDNIVQSKSFSDWSKALQTRTPSWCYYDFDSTSKNILYNYYCINDERSIAIEGWKLPSYKDFEILENYLDDGNERNAGYKMKSQTDWGEELYDNGVFDMNGSNESLFNAKPTGILWNDSFSSITATGWWCVSKNEPGSYFTIQWAYGNELFDKINHELSYGLSIRLIKK